MTASGKKRRGLGAGTDASGVLLSGIPAAGKQASQMEGFNGTEMGSGFGTPFDHSRSGSRWISIHELIFPDLR